MCQWLHFWYDVFWKRFFITAHGNKDKIYQDDYTTLEFIGQKLLERIGQKSLTNYWLYKTIQENKMMPTTKTVHKFRHCSFDLSLLTFCSMTSSTLCSVACSAHMLSHLSTSCLFTYLLAYLLNHRLAHLLTCSYSLIHHPTTYSLTHRMAHSPPQYLPSRHAHFHSSTYPLTFVKLLTHLPTLSHSPTNPLAQTYIPTHLLV